MSADGMNVGFLPRVLPTTPTGRLSLGRRGPARAQADQPQAPSDAVAAIDDATLAAGPRKRRRGTTLAVDLRPATAATNPLATLWTTILAIASTLRARLNGIDRSSVRLGARTHAGAGTAPQPSPAERTALANLRASIDQAAVTARARVMPAAAAARVRLAPVVAAARTGAAAARVRAAGTTTDAGPPFGRLKLPAALVPVARLDRRVLATIGVLSVAAIYAVTVAEPPAAPQQVAAAERPAMPAAKSDAPPPDPALAAPFSQKSINTELRSLRKALEPGDQARSLTVLSDGTMGMNIVNNGAAANVMVRGQDIAIEPLAGDPESGATLDVNRVHGTAITRFLDEATTTYQLPKSELGSLRLIEDEAKPGTFIWIGVWNDAARTTLYADREAQTVGESRPR